MSSYILVDFSWLCHRSFHGFKSDGIPFHTSYDKVTSHLYGVQDLIKLAIYFNTNNICLILDKGTSNRVAEMNSYKSGRPEAQFDM